MSRDSDLSNQPATRGDVADIAIDAMLGFSCVAAALSALKRDKDADISELIETISEMRQSLDKKFDRLTGWKK